MLHVNGCNCTECKRIARAAKREEKRRIVARNEADRPVDPYVAATGRAAFIKGYQRVADERVVNRLARAIVDHKIIENHGIERAREILISNVKTRALVVVERNTDHVVKPGKANSTVVKSQCKVRAAKDKANGEAHALHVLRAEHMRLVVLFANSTGKARKATRSALRACEHRLLTMFGVRV